VRRNDHLRGERSRPDADAAPGGLRDARKRPSRGDGAQPDPPHRFDRRPRRRGAQSRDARASATVNLDADVDVRIGDFTLRAAFEAADRELLAVAGPNGAGKTTLLRALAGLERITAGRIVVDGRVYDDGTTFVRPDNRDVALLPQRDYLLPHLSAVDNVAFGLLSRGAQRRSARSAALECLDTVSLRDAADARPNELSGGQARRVALARTLAVRPAVLLLDEPLAAIDATSVRVVRDVLRDYDGSRVRIVVAHDAVHALSLASRVVVLEDGRLVQDASVEDIRARPRSRYVADFLGV